jgi:hypothetical protein
MFRTQYQAGFLSILYSIGSKPLQIWDKKGASGGWFGTHSLRSSPPPLPSPFRAVRNGHIKRITDSEIQSSVLEIAGSNVSTTFITCPSDPKKTLGIKLPFLVMIIKNMKKYFTFEVTVLDDKNVHRRFRASNYQVRA